MSADLCVSSSPGDIVGSAADQGCSSVVSKLLHHLVSSVTPKSVSATELLSVLAVHRYLGEPASEASCGPPSGYLYDVTVSDGSCQVKCHLSPELNPLVQRNCLRAGRGIRVTRCSLVYDEKRLSRCFLQIESLELDASEHTSQVDVGTLSAAPLRDLTTNQRGRDLLTTLQSATPLKGGRAHYLPLWNNTDPCGAEWNSSKQLPAAEVPFEACGLISLETLSRTWRTRVEFPHLLVRVMYKSRLRYYGRPGTKVDFPYQAYLEVADQTGMMSVVLWNSLCREWYQSLHVGTVLLLHRYSIKQSYQRRTWATPCDSQMKSYRFIEICLNPRDPHTEIQIVPTKQVKAEWRLPNIKYNFITRVELDNMPDAYTCDIIGVVTFVGRCQRGRKEEGSEDFFLYRWVHAVDGSTQQPFILELFATSQPETFEQIHPMTYLVCTQMRVVREFSVPYLTTSNESQISISGHHKGQPYTQDPKVQGFIQWVKGQREKDLLKRSVVGGYYSFPPAPNLFQDYCKNLNAEAVLTSTSDLMKVIASLHYREHRRITLQAIIAAVQFIGPTESAEGRGTDHVQNTRDSAGLSLKEGDPFSRLSSEPERVGELPDKGLRQTAKSLQTVPTKDQQRHRSPVLNHYVLRHRYPLRDLQKTSSKGQAPRPTREKLLNSPGALKRRKQANTSKVLLLKRRSSDQDADETVNDKGFSQGAEEPVAANRDEDRTAETDLNYVSRYTWRSTMWSEIRGQLSAHLHFGQLLSESVSRKFDYKHREFLMQQYNLQAAEYKPATVTSSMDLQRFGPACNHGYYSVTIVGINHQVAVDVVFLPALKSHEGLCTLGRPMESHDNRLASVLASGYICDKEPTDNNQKGHTSASPDHIVRTAAELDNLHVICVLDLCHYGGDKSEVILNKIYKVTE
ncbi:RPA-related protein RADX isoform X2 [Pristis pectinata]|uniref:RPA-related protein RADX isoform X2 n=1 Tax=Pristis pectinata TaxID=685728 RepID=UPI00223CF0DB|nr:RPA-related protein RADX isoform X2 [Pristis pectinata]XP_051876771.1 RPA-related protein RADX isoform X2 [Pristis pectinata]